MELFDRVRKGQQPEPDDYHRQDCQLAQHQDQRLHGIHPPRDRFGAKAYSAHSAVSTITAVTRSSSPIDISPHGKLDLAKRVFGEARKGQRACLGADDPQQLQANWTGTGLAYYIT